VTWAEFRREVFGDPYLVWHDGADFAELLARYRTDPGTVERMLRMGIDEGDHVAVESIGVLAHADLAPRDSVPLLESALPGAAGTMRVRLAQVLLVLTGDQCWAAEVSAVLAQGGSWSPRIDAAIALADFVPTPELARVLARAVQDDEYLVRHHAADTLLAYAGRRRDVHHYPRLFTLIIAADPAAWQAAATKLVDALALPENS